MEYVFVALQVVAAVLKTVPSAADAAVVGVDPRSLHIWSGQALDVALEVGDTVVKFSSGAPTSDVQWRSLADALPAAEVRGLQRRPAPPPMHLVLAG